MDRARTAQRPAFESIDHVIEALGGQGYLADRSTATVVYLADRLGKPLLIEGPAGVGKTQLATSLAEVTGRRLLRLQCYEGQDESKALYEWDYGKQLLYTQILEEAGKPCPQGYRHHAVGFFRLRFFRRLFGDGR